MVCDIVLKMLLFVVVCAALASHVAYGSTADGARSPRSTTYAYEPKYHDQGTKPISDVENHRHWMRMLPCGSDDSTFPRVVINSHVKYVRALDQLLHSMLSIGFGDFCRVLVVVAGSARSLPPSRAGPITFVDEALNAGDMTAYNALANYQNHSWVASSSYLYMHDTCLVVPQFVRWFWWMHTHYAEHAASSDVFMCPTPSANIIALGAALVPRIAADHNIVGVNISKKETLRIENGIDAPQQYGNVTMLNGAGWGLEGDPVAPFDDGVDVYGTGFPRQIRLFPDFGIIKFVLLNKYGDLSEGKVFDN